MPDIHAHLHLPTWTFQDRERTIENWEIHLHPQELAVVEKPCERKVRKAGALFWRSLHHSQSYTYKDGKFLSHRDLHSDLSSCPFHSPRILSSRARSVRLVLAEHSDSTLLSKIMCPSHQSVNVCHYVGVWIKRDIEIYKCIGIY